MNKTRVLVVDDHTLVRKGLVSILDRDAGIEIVGEAENGREALAKVPALSPQIVLMDISMPDLNGLEATHQMKRRFPEVKVLILTMHADEEYVAQILRAGASGYVLKKAAPAELLMAIHAVSRGDSFLSPSISRTVIAGYIQQTGAMAVQERYSMLTPREREILQLIGEGLSTRLIADRLCISVKTAETHRSHIMEKLELHGTAALIKYAVRKGIVAE